MICVENITKYYGRCLAVDNISFAVGKGEIVGFLGPNAAGKTTTMRIITGFLAATQGSAQVAGYDIAVHPLEARRHIGYLPETVPLYTDMTVRAYLGYMARLRGLDSKRIRARIEDVVETCHLKKYIDVLIGKLSKGFRQRVGVAQAIIHEPEVLVLDEPTVGIDPIQVAMTRKLIKDLGKKSTILLSTHILSEVSMTCERVIIIHQGRIVAQDRIENLSSLVGGKRYIRLAIEGPVDRVVEGLRQIDSVTQVRYEDSHYIVEYPTGLDLRVRIQETIARSGWLSLSMEVMEMSLEDVFLKLTTEEARE